jgi:23S rRNA (guanine2535-N1)-methyltransferase
VLYAQPGQPALPVRLTCEIFQRCLEHIPAEAREGRLRLYDPCCGGAYHLTVLGFLYGERIASILASDFDRQPLSLAERNLGLLGLEGFDRRIAELQTMRDTYGKASHAKALQSAQRLRNPLAHNIQSHAIECRVFQADGLNSTEVLSQVGNEKIDLVIADVPYGHHAHWEDRDSGGKPAMERLLESVLGVLSSQGVVAIVADKGQKVAHPAFMRMEKFKVGKRQVTILAKVGTASRSTISICPPSQGES